MPHIEVNGIVATRDRKPYVQLLKDKEDVAQFTIAQARSVAMDLLRAASYAEADAMLGNFFREMDLSDAALRALLVKFRSFRWENEQEKVETSYAPPDDQKGPANA